MDTLMQQALDRIDQVTGHLAADALTRAIPGQWSVAEILEHLALAYGATTRVLERALATGRISVPGPAPLQWFARTLVVDVGYFPRVKAPEEAVPRGLPGDRARDDARAALRAADDALTRAGQRFGLDVRVMRHPYFAGMTVPHWRKFHWRHTLHHMRQAEARLRA